MPTIKLFANLRKVAGLKETPIEGSNIWEVLIELIRQKPGLEPYLVENGHIRRHVVITLNGHPTTDEQAPVTEKDEIAIFPPIAGGSPHPYPSPKGRGVQSDIPISRRERNQSSASEKIGQHRCIGLIAVLHIPDGEWN